jgi:hypothetical protein
MRLRWLCLSIALAAAACSGIATVDIFFSSPPPQRDGANSISIRVTEGLGSAMQVLDDRVEAWDVEFESASLRVPFGGNRMVTVQIETNETPPRVLASGRSFAFRLEESDDPLLTITMSSPPDPGSARVLGASGGRVASATVGFGLMLGFAAGVLVSEDPFFEPSRSTRFNPGDPRLMFGGSNPPEINLDFVIDSRCADRAGCPRTVYFRSLDPFGAESAAYSTSLIYDPFAPRLLDASVRIDGGAVLGTGGVAEIITEFDEPVGLSTFASLSGGAFPCPNQVEVDDGMLAGLDFPADCAGTYTIELTATDLAGNSVRLFEVATLVVDRLPPPPLDLTLVTSTCAGDFEIIAGAAGAAESRALVDAAGARARADAEGAFVIAAEPGEVELVQIDDAGNGSVGRRIEVVSCDP